MVKIIIPSARRAETCTTPGLLDAEGIPYTLVLHTEEERDAYIKAGRVDPASIVVSGQPRRIPIQRQWIQSNLVEMGEWFISLDDNIRWFNAMPEPFYWDENANANGALRYVLEMAHTSASRFIRICDEMIAESARRGAYLFGFAVTDNGLFRRNKWREIGYVSAKAMGVQRTHIDYDPRVRSIDDFAFTAAHLYAFGRVLINDYAQAYAYHYQAGGIGKLQERIPDRLHDCRLLVESYPGLLEYKPPKGDMPAHCDLRVRLTSIQQVEKWRRQLAAQRAAEAER